MSAYHLVYSGFVAGYFFRSVIGWRLRRGDGPMTVDWKQWGLGGSISFRRGIVVRLWLGPVRVGVAWDRGPTIG